MGEYPVEMGWIPNRPGELGVATVEMLDGKVVDEMAENAIGGTATDDDLVGERLFHASTFDATGVSAHPTRGDLTRVSASPTAGRAAMHGVT